MSDIKKLLESIDSMSQAASKPTGPKFPGYWRRHDSASKAKSRMVGGAQESIIKELDKTAKETTTKRTLEKKLENLKLNEKLSIDPDAGPAYYDRTSKTWINAPANAWRDSSGQAVLDTEGKPVLSGSAVSKIAPVDDVEKELTQRFGKLKSATAPSSRPIDVPTSKAEPSRVEVYPVRQREVDSRPLDTADQPEGFGRGRPPGAQSVPYATDREVKTLSPRQQAIQDIATLNNIADPNKIRIGQVLKLPDGSTYTVAKGDNLWNISKGKFRGTTPSKLTTNENYLNKFRLFLEYGNAQDPNAQTTSPVKATSPEEQAQKQKAAQDQRVDATTAKNLAGSIKPVLPPNIDSNTLASAIVKINDNKPLTQPEQMAMGPMNALVTKAAETTQTSNELGNILRTVAQLAKKGKA